VRATSLAVVTLLTGGALASQSSPHVPITRFIEAASSDSQISTRALNEIRAGWRDAYTPMFIDLTRVMRPPRRLSAPDDSTSPPLLPDGDDDSGRRGTSLPTTPDIGSPVRRRLLQFLERQTGQRLGDDLDRWRAWVWSRPFEPHPDYAVLKRAVYGDIDPRMRAFFPDGVQSAIRLDQIDWGGVGVNGIPPLRRRKSCRLRPRVI
jgi:hypothetical protein